MSAEGQSVETFTAEQAVFLLEGIDGVPTDVVGVFRSVLEAETARRREAEEDAKLQQFIRNFAVSFERTGSEGSDSNIEGWMTDLSENAEELLAAAGEHELPEAGLLAKRTAAATYVFMRVEHPHETVDDELLHSAGFDPDELLEEYKAAITAALDGINEQNRAYLLQNLSEVDYLNGLGIILGMNHRTSRYNSLYWERFIRPMGNEMRSKLIDSGMDLPELNEDGLYRGEADDEF